MNRKALIISLAVVAMGVSTWGGVTNYVNRAAGLDAAGRGGSGAPFASIQYAVDNTDAGGVILVAPGVYDNGYGLDPQGYTNRVYINKSLTLKATGAKEDTIIQGAKDFSETMVAGCDGIGPKALRCFYCNTDKVVIFEGFTLQGGACHTATNAISGYGGGFYTESGKTYLVDCVIRDCVGYRGGASLRGTMIRCLLTENHAVKKATATWHGTLVNCLVVHNSGGSGNTFVDAKVYNCTVDDNSESMFSEKSVAYNVCGVLCNANIGDKTGTSVTPTVSVYNSLFSSNNFYKADYATVLDAVNCKVDASRLQYVAPMLNDYRLLPDAEAIGAGDASYLANVSVPTSIDVYLDYTGVAIPKTGTINVGAIQTPVPQAPAGGCIVFPDKVRLVGGAAQKCNGSYAYAMDYPTQWHIYASDSTQVVYCYGIVNYEAIGYSGSVRFPEMDDGLWIMPPPAGLVLTNSVSYAKSVIYVDPTATALGANGSQAHPYRTLKAAVDVATASTRPAVILAAAGDYREGTMAAGSFTNRVAIDTNIRLKGAGAGKSFIYGASDTTSDDRCADGRGAHALRCAYVANGCIQGFTLSDGRSAYNGGSSDNVEYTCGGGVFCGSSGWVLDSIITNGIAYRGGAFMNGRAARCRFVDCQAGNGVIRYGTFYACQFDHMDKATVAVVGSNANAYNCTMMGSGDTSVAWGGACACNCVISRPASASVAAYGTLSSDAAVTGSVVWAYKKYNQTAVNYIKQDPCFVDDVDDLRLLSSSPAIGSGFAEGYWKHYSSDLEGNPILFKNGRPTAGARQVPVQAVVVKKNVAGDALDKPEGTYALEPGESLTLTFSDTTRHVEALLVGAEQNRVEGTSITFTAATDGTVPTAGYDAAVQAVYSTNWYVNANALDDSGNGFTPETAKKTFAALFTDCTGIQKGDCVHAAEGVYNSGEMTHFTKDVEHLTKNRVEIPPHVAVVADGDVHKTFIVGENSRDEAQFVDKLGRGTNAVRCVFAQDYSTLRGFTLTGGRTCGDGSDNNDNYGGAVFSSSTNAIIADCIISNNASTRAGGAHNVRCVNCQFFYNYAIKNRAAASKSHLYGCVFDHNRGVNTVQNCYDVINCTFGSDNLDEAGTSATYGYGLPLDRIVNCIFLGKYDGNKDAPVYASNCVFNVNHKREGDAFVYSDCKFVQPAELALDAAYRPLAGCAAIDAGANALAFASEYLPMDNDLSGTQRIYNRTIDAGALEYDWRPNYTTALNPTICAVVAATPDVALTEDRLELTDRLDTVVTNPLGQDIRVRYGLKVHVTGTGALTVFVNGQAWKTFTAADGVTQDYFRSGLAQNAVTYQYVPGADDTGAALIYPSTYSGGLRLHFR